MSAEGTSSDQGSSVVAVPGANIPIITISTQAGQDGHQKPTQLPKLPSSRYRYTVWHELQSNEIQGNDLNNPRVRAGPEIKDKIFYSIKDEQGKRLHHSKKGKEKRDYEKRIENWENSVTVNLSHQELGDRYQTDNFLRILKRLIRAERIQLMHNNLEDLSKVTFPSCTVLNLNSNFFTSFTKLPKCPNLKMLQLSDNSISSMDGLQNFRKCSLVTLDLRRNPVCFQDHYRQRIFQILPELEELDGIPRLTSDIDGDLEPQSGCILS